MIRRTRPARIGAWAVALAFSVPFVILLLQSFVESWRAPAVLPQRFGLRAWSIVLAEGTAARPALVNSALVALATTTIALFLAWPAARALGESRLRRPTLVVVVMTLPVLVPPYAVGTGLAEWFIRLGLVDSLSALILAHMVYVLPYVVLLLASGFSREVESLEEAARAMGAGTVHRLRFVTIPAIAPSLALAALMGFLVSWGQYGTSLSVGGGIAMLPVVLVPFVQADPPVAAALGSLFLAPAVFALIVASRQDRMN